jgi:hypothetical protein
MECGQGSKDTRLTPVTLGEPKSAKYATRPFGRLALNVWRRHLLEGQLQVTKMSGVKEQVTRQLDHGPHLKLSPLLWEMAM